MTRLALVTLASIVEGEARADEERETIAGVYHNRLRIGMPLQADPTVQYAIMLKRGRRKTRLFIKDYQIASPYNTYLNRGLPPAPVNSPGRRSIEATLYPADVQLSLLRGRRGRASCLLPDVQRTSPGDSEDQAGQRGSATAGQHDGETVAERQTWFEDRCGLCLRLLTR